MLHDFCPWLLDDCNILGKNCWKLFVHFLVRQQCETRFQSYSFVTLVIRIWPFSVCTHTLAEASKIQTDDVSCSTSSKISHMENHYNRFETHVHLLVQTLTLESTIDLISCATLDGLTNIVNLIFYMDLLWMCRTILMIVSWIELSIFLSFWRKKLFTVAWGFP